MPIDFRFDPTRIFGPLRASLQLALVDATEGVRNEAVRLILNGSKTGRIYRRKGVTHQASAPGQPPASDTGNLANSITTSYELGSLTGIVNVGAKYGAFLEYGTRHIAPRPFMTLALANSKARIKARFQEAAKAAKK